MKKYFYILYVFSLMLMISCKKDLLDSTPQDRYTDDAVFKDSTFVNLYVNKLYADLPSQFEPNVNASDMLSNYTDESAPITSLSYSYGYNQNQYNSSNFFPSTFYYPAFFVDIRYCNVFLDNIAGVPASDAFKKRMTGQVRFLRALYYHYIYLYFGRFPILKTTLQLGDNLYVPRGTDADCIDFITSELNAAADLLPTAYTGADIGRATKGAAYALLSRVNLYTGQWQNASDAAKKVMNLGVYALFPDYQGIFTPVNENNQEVIFDRQYIAASNSLQYSNIDFYNSPGIYTGKNSGNTDPSETLVSKYEMKDGTAFDWNNPVQAANPYANRDPRLEASIIHDGTIWAGRTVDMKAGSVFNPLARPSATGYYMKKFLNPNYNYTDATNSSGQNFIIIRYAEVLLNYAEAQLKLGNTEEARKYVNIIRARPSVNMPPVLASDFSFDSYAHEREIELAFEGLRLWDINRWKIGPQTRGSDLHGVMVTVNPSGIRTYQKVVAVRGGTQRIFLEKMYLFPIPLTEIQKYPNNSLEQNQGW